MTKLLFIFLWGIALSICLSTSLSRAQDSLKVTPVALEGLQRLIHADSGKGILVNFWATWCKPCNEEMPALVQVRNEMSGKPFELLLVSLDDSDLITSEVPKALRRHGVDFPTYLMHGQTDEELINGMGNRWGGALPASFFYNRAGRLVDVMSGGKTIAQFRTAVRNICR